MTVLRILTGVPGIRRVGRDSDGCDVPLFEEGGQDIHYGLKRKDYTGPEIITSQGLRETG